MEYCPYTNSSHPICVVNRVVRLNEYLRELLREALEKGRAERGYGDPHNCAGPTICAIMEARLLGRDSHSATFELSFEEHEIVFTVPLSMLQE